MSLRVAANVRIDTMIPDKRKGINHFDYRGFPYNALFWLLPVSLVTACGGGGGGGAAVADQFPEVRRYWTAQTNFDYSSTVTSPLQQAFKDVGLDAARVDRSAKAFVGDRDQHGTDIRNLLAGNGLDAGVNYSYVTLDGFTNMDGTFIYLTPFVAAYQRTPADGMASYSYSSLFTSDQTVVQGLNQNNIESHSWLLVPTGNEGEAGPLTDRALGLMRMLDLSIPSDRAIQARVTARRQGTLLAAATGKLRMFYGLNADQTARHSRSNGCWDIETICIGTPYQYSVDGNSIRGTSFSTPYGFATYLMAWERLPQSVGISIVFDMGDKCTQDMGMAGPDADTGLGRLDIGCMAAETYRKRVRLLRGAQHTDLQQFTDDFAQSLFAPQLGHLTLPGKTGAQFRIGFEGDSLRSHYRPTAHTPRRYHPGLPLSLRLWKTSRMLGVSRIGHREFGFFLGNETLVAGISHRRTSDFFGGYGSGQFAFGPVRNLRLLVQGHAVSDHDPESGLTMTGWVRQASTKGDALLDSLKGWETGLALTHRHGVGALDIGTYAWISRFHGGSVSVAGNRFAIEPSQAEHGVSVSLNYSF